MIKIFLVLSILPYSTYAFFNLKMDFSGLNSISEINKINLDFTGIDKLSALADSLIDSDTNSSTDINTIDYNNFTTHNKVDLNGDGKKETISLKDLKPETYSQGEDNFVLTVGDTSVKGNLTDGNPDGLVIVDIDKSDKYKEIAVHTREEKENDEFLIYSYDGKSLKKMGSLYRWPTFYGNGIVLVDQHIDFWSLREKYVLDTKTRTLKLVPQKFYYVGIKGKVTKSFPLYRTKERKHIVANLKPQSEIVILLCEPSVENKDSNDVDIKDYSYLIKSSTGLVGWTTHNAFWEHNVEGLPQGD